MNTSLTVGRDIPEPQIKKAELIITIMDNLVKHEVDSNFAVSTAVGVVNNLPIEVKDNNDMKILLKKVSKSFESTIKLL